MTRDSKILPILQISALVLAAMVAMMTNPADYGLSPIVVKWLALISTIVGTVAGFLGTSPLRGETDPNKVSPPKLPAILLAVAVGGALLAASGCAGRQTAPLVMPTSTAAVATDDAALRAYAQKSVGVLDAALDVVREVNVAEKKVEVLMSPSMLVNTRAAMTAVTQQIITAAKAIQAGAKSFAALKALLDPVLTKVQALVELVHALPASAQNRQGFGPLVSTLLGIVTTIVTGAHQ